MRKVFPTEQVIHLWSNQSQESARNSSNCHYEGKLLFSYSTVIAQLETALDGQIWSFLSSESLTSTTGKHVWSSRSATRQRNQFLTPAFGSWSHYGRTILEMVEPKVKELENDFSSMPALRANLPYAITKYHAGINSLNEVCSAFNIPLYTLPVVSEVLIQKAEKYRLQSEYNQEHDKEIKIAKQAKQRALDVDALEIWLTTGKGYFPASYESYHNDMITVKGDNVVTSQGAQAPLSHVIKALQFYDSRWFTTGAKLATENITPSYTPYQTNGHKIALGNFTLDSIDESGNVKAGCHCFTYAEISRFRKVWSL